MTSKHYAGVDSASGEDVHVQTFTGLEPETEYSILFGGESNLATSNAGGCLCVAVTKASEAAAGIKSDDAQHLTTLPPDTVIVDDLTDEPVTEEQRLRAREVLRRFHQEYTMQVHVPEKLLQGHQHVPGTATAARSLHQTGHPRPSIYDYFRPATPEEVTAGTDEDKPLTPLKLSEYLQKNRDAASRARDRLKEAVKERMFDPSWQEEQMKALVDTGHSSLKVDWDTMTVTDVSDDVRATPETCKDDGEDIMAAVRRFSRG